MVQGARPEFALMLAQTIVDKLEPVPFGRDRPFLLALRNHIVAFYTS